MLVLYICQHPLPNHSIPHPREKGTNSKEAKTSRVTQLVQLKELEAQHEKTKHGGGILKATLKY